LLEGRARASWHEAGNICFCVIDPILRSYALPKDELLVLKAPAVSELGTVCRELGHIARAMQVATRRGPCEPGLRTVLRYCEVSEKTEALDS